VAKPLADGLLAAIANTLGCANVRIARKHRLFDKRIADIENYILMNATDPELSHDRVAENCGISPRYLCYALKAHGTSFSELLWKTRLPRARERLISPKLRDFQIHEISFMSGFKSAAHFSRMFKAEYGCTPRRYRERYLTTETALDEE
jgi:AraC-like DNA-binding protein